MKLTRFRKFLGLILLADGVGSLISPVAYRRSLEFGSPTMNDILEFLAENPGMTRKLAVGEIALGLCLAVA